MFYNSRKAVQQWSIIMNNERNLRYIGRLFLALLLMLTSQLTVAKATELSGIRLGQTPDQTRVVFEIRNNDSFDVMRLSNPERVVVDFHHARNAVSFKNQRFQDQRVASMRISSNEKRTRVVLDLRDAYQYKYFTLGKNGPRPERLVIDLTEPMLAKVDSPSQLASAQVEEKPQPVARVESAPKEVNKVVARKPTPSVVARTKSVSNERVQPNSATESLLNNNRDFVQTKQFIVAIDPGHGGRDVGAIGPAGTYEKDVVLAQARALKKVIDAQPGMKAVLTRDSDVYLQLHERVDIAKQKNADIFISVHADAYSSAAPKGGSVYVLSNTGASSVMARTLAKQENAALGVLQLAGRDKDVAFVLSDLTREANIRASRKLGQSVLSEMQRTVKVHKHAIQSADFAVLKSIDMPSMLLEVAFISNPIEEKKLQDPRFHQTFAQAVTRGLNKFIDQTGHAPRWGETLYVNYEVQRGDTLSDIAQAYGVGSRDLMNINNIGNANQLYVGRKLKVPVTDKLTVQYDLKYTVRRGDTLSQIAQAHKVDVDELMRVNKIKNANQLYVGKELTVPVRESVLAAAH